MDLISKETEETGGPVELGAARAAERAAGRAAERVAARGSDTNAALAALPDQPEDPDLVDERLDPMAELRMLRRQVQRERARRQAAENLGERVTRDLYESVRQLRSAQAELLERADRSRVVNELARSLRPGPRHGPCGEPCCRGGRHHHERRPVRRPAGRPSAGGTGRRVLDLSLGEVHARPGDLSPTCPRGSRR